MASSERSSSADRSTDTGDTVFQRRRADTDPRALGRGQTLGRFVVVERVGAGGMGIVYKAYDPELDRTVAVKVLKGAQPARGRERLLREAQALARLSHPHVIAVHDVITDGDEVFVAMEFVQGPTVAQWLAAAPRTRRQILDVFCDAGAGLAAAHAVGLVHRDVKPANLMIGADGRVRVLDFGVARAAGGDPDPATPSGEGSDTTSRVSRLDAPLTVVGAMVGTPRYMAPEQYQRRDVDARTDQFSFCLALWEALAGEYPFGDRDERRLRVLAGNLPPARGHLTRRLRGVLARGLAPAPGDRFPSMDALIAALRRDPARAIGRVAGVAVVVGAIATAVIATRREAVAPCQDARAHMAAIWDTPERLAVARAFAATGAPFAADAARQVERGLDRWSDRWVDMHTDACRATRVRGEQSDALLDLRMACLDRRRERARASIALLTAADRDVVTRAGDLIDDLPSLDECADAVALRRAQPAPTAPSARAVYDRALAALARASALDSAGKYPDAITAAQQAIELGNRAAHPPTVAEALIVLASARGSTGGDAEVGPALREAMRTAALGRADAVEARAWLGFVHQVGDIQSHYDQVEPWLPEVRALVERTGDVALAAELDFDLGAMAWRRGHYDEALAFAQRSLAAYQGLYGPDDRRVMQPVWVIANVTDERGDHAAAIPLYQRILDVDRAVLGAQHPRVAQDYINLGTVRGSIYDDAAALEDYQRGLAILEVTSPGSGELSSALINVGTVHTRQGRHQLAAAAYARAIAMIEKAQGPDHPDVAHALLNASETLRAQGRLDESRRALERTLAIWTRTYGGDHPYLAYAELAMAATLDADHRSKDALAHARRALAIAQAQLGPEHEIVPDIRSEIGTAEVGLGHTADGLAELRAAVALAEKVSGAGSSHVASAMVALGRMEARAGATAAAEADLDRAIRIADATGAPPIAAEGRFAMTHLLVTRDPSRARALAEQARAAVEVPGAGPTRLGSEIDAWLAAPATARLVPAR